MKAINIIIAIGTAIIVASLLQLGIRAFHPEPPNPFMTRVSEKPAPVYDTPCETSDTACITQRARERKEFEAQEQAFAESVKRFDTALRTYNRDVFIIANTVGLLVFAIGFWLIFATSAAGQAAPIGVMMAGFWGVIYGYARGWRSIDDMLKFLIGLVIATVLIGSSIFLVRRYEAKKSG